MINNTIYRENLEYFADIRKDDQMTPIERSNALAKGEEVDRMPVQMMAGFGIAGSYRNDTERVRAFSEKQGRTSDCGISFVWI